MKHIFKDLISSGHVLISVDGIIMFTTNINKHFEVVNRLMMELKIKNSVKIHVEKCEILKKSISYLDHRVVREGKR